MRRDPTVMIVRDAPLIQYVISAACIVASLAFAMLAVSEGDGKLLTPSAIAFGLGALITVLSPVTIATFDRGQGTYEIRTRGVIRRRKLDGSLANIALVRVDTSVTDPVYRVVVVLRTGPELPLSSWWANSKRRSRKVAARLNAFLSET